MTKTINKTIEKEKIQKDRKMKCCDKCWNSKFALKGKQKEKFALCGLTCECHKKQWDEQSVSPVIEEECKIHHQDIRKCDECFQGDKETKEEWTIALIVSTVIFTIFLSLFVGIKGNYTEYNTSWMLVPTIISAIFVLMRQTSYWLATASV